MKKNVYFGSYLPLFFLELKNVPDKRRRENQNTNLCSITFFFPKILPLMKLTKWSTRIACWIPKVTNTLS